MGMKILFRENSLNSPFRAALCNLISIKGNKLVLTTGYVNPYVPSKTYYQDLLNSIESGFASVDEDICKIIVIGGMIRHKLPGSSGVEGICNCDSCPACSYSASTATGKCPQCDFRKFLINLRGSLDTISRKIKKNIVLEYYRSKNNRFHGKIAIKLDNDNPMAAIVGSSNLTNAALVTEIQNKTYFDRYASGKDANELINHEADVVIFSKTLNDIKKTLSQELKGIIDESTTLSCMKNEELDTLFKDINLLGKNIKSLKSNEEEYLINKIPKISGILTQLNVVNDILYEGDSYGEIDEIQASNYEDNLLPSVVVVEPKNITSDNFLNRIKFKLNQIMNFNQEGKIVIENVNQKIFSCNKCKEE